MDYVESRSELSFLLKQNISEEGLDTEQFARALKLINSPEVVHEGEECHLCEKPPIYDTGLCKGHASYTLKTRK